jgi:hypothetical protein
MTATAYDAGMATFRASLDEAKAARPSEVWRVGGRRTKAYPDKENEAWWYTEGAKLVHAYYDFRMTYPNLRIWRTPTDIPAIELEMNVRISDEVTLKCFVDRVFEDTKTGDLLLVDLKTGKAPPSALQLAVYNLALQETFGTSCRYGAYWLARQGSLDTIHDLTALPHHTVRTWLIDTTTQIRAGRFVPKMSERCGYCGVKEHCYAWNPALTPNSHLPLEITERKE